MKKCEEKIKKKFKNLNKFFFEMEREFLTLGWKMEQTKKS